MKLTIILFAVIFPMTLNAQSNSRLSHEMKKDTSQTINKNSNYSYAIIPSQHNTWGYNIYLGKQLLINQPCVPGLPGNDGFKSKSDAKKVAMLVIRKIRKGEMPPTVTSEELKKLKVLESKK